MKQFLLLLACAGLILQGCAPTELNRFDLNVSDRVCNVDALAREKQTAQATLNSSKYSIREYQNRAGSYEENTYTILESKLFSYEAELEASYRFVVQNCGVYTRCIERQDYDEWQCKRTEERWGQSQDRFNNLIINIRTLQAEVEKARIKAKRKKKGRRGGKDRRGRDDRCCNTLGNVFTDCCG